MTRMMKRKIHPDIEGKIIQKNYKEIQLMSNLLMPDFNTDGPPNESISLLQTQGTLAIYIYMLILTFITNELINVL